MVYKSLGQPASKYQVGLGETRILYCCEVAWRLKL